MSAANVASTVSRSSAKDSVIDLRKQRVEYRQKVKMYSSTEKDEDKIKLVFTVNNAARAVGSRIQQVKVVYKDITQKITIANSDGLLIHDKRRYVGMEIDAISKKEGILRIGRQVYSSPVGIELFETSLANELGHMAGKIAIEKLSAKPAPAGEMTVILGAGDPGAMFHEACGHAFEADNVQKGASFYASLMNQNVASSSITAVDDATLEEGPGSINVDDEGTFGQRTVLIEKGVLRSFMHSRLTAENASYQSTGNGRRVSYAYPPIPRMTNTFIVAGKHDPNEIIENTKRGILVLQIGGGTTDMSNGDFLLSVAEGYLIEKGKIAAPIYGVTILGNGPEVLKTIDMVGNDLKVVGTRPEGGCGKKDQFPLIVGYGQPTLRIPKMIVGGTK